jgi:K+-sensing histidine kinase KdpD
MEALRNLPQRRGVLVVLAASIPLLLSALLAGLRSEVANAPAALVLAVAVVAAAATGVRSAGLAASLSAALSFDLLLTQPYGRLAIDDREDLETTILLMAVGLAVTELALWGRRQQARASRSTGFLEGLATTAQAARAGKESPQQLIDDIAARIVEVLDLDSCRFRPGRTPHGLPMLHRDGTVTRSGVALDVRRDGLPVDSELVLEVGSGPDAAGCFLLVAASHLVRPSVDQRRIAALLADQATDAARTVTHAP